MTRVHVRRRDHVRTVGKRDSEEVPVYLKHSALVGLPTRETTPMRALSASQGRVL